MVLGKHGGRAVQQGLVVGVGHRREFGIVVVESRAHAGQVDAVSGHADAAWRQAFDQRADRADRDQAIHLRIGHGLKVGPVLDAVRGHSAT